MYCADCDDCCDASNGDGFSRHVCAYTGVTVYPAKYANPAGHLAVGDLKDAICPRRLETLLYSHAGRMLTRGILVAVAARGELRRLLGCYTAREAVLLEGLAASRAAKLPR